ncbi:unnamed protein product [Hermetia illucens]|uniref:Uncharacterized protein n=1 Tax=Hermetia illucens TaxID=343691 RepID=A0A7R8UV31_HERIL|nr:general odorant-binding protein 99a-like [Hermetia illucens]CAD7087215.1 unnamed protein product [Hermetia illucens]
MKLFIALCAVIAMASAFNKEEFLKIREECFKSEKVPEAVIEKLKNHEYGHDLGHEAKCYIRCLGLKTGIWDDTHGYNVEKSYEDFHDAGLEVSKENLKKCFTSNPDNDDKCVWAAKDMKCLFTNKYVSRKQ